MRVVDREERQRFEDTHLDSSAARCAHGVRRLKESAGDLLRTDFQCDRDKIIHCKSFRRLSHKTQVFLAVEGDHFRTRLTHTLEVAQIARTVARALNLNEDLTEAIALGHDLGHTPFGHAGEDALDSCWRYHLEQTTGKPAGIQFRHNEQSLRVIDVLERNGEGLNLCWDVRNGIICHTGATRAATLEGRVVAVADRIAYVNHDVDDAVRAGLISESDIPDKVNSVLGTHHSQRVESLVCDLVKHSVACDDILLSENTWDALCTLRSFLFQVVYKSPQVLDQAHRGQRIVRMLFDYFVEHPHDIPQEIRECSCGDTLRAAADYIAGMTDRFAVRSFEDIFIVKPIA